MVLMMLASLIALPVALAAGAPPEPPPRVYIEEEVFVNPDHRLTDCAGGEAAARLALEMAPAPIFRSDDWRLVWNDPAHPAHMHAVRLRGDSIELDRAILPVPGEETYADLVATRATHLVIVGAAIRLVERPAEGDSAGATPRTEMYVPPYTIAFRVVEPENGGRSHEMPRWPNAGALLCQRGTIRTNWFPAFERESVLSLAPEPREILVPGVELRWQGAENVPRYRLHSREQVLMGIVHEDYEVRTYEVRVAGVRNAQALVSPPVLRIHSGDVEPPQKMTIGVYVDHAGEGDAYEYAAEVWPPAGEVEGRWEYRYTFRPGERRSHLFEVEKMGPAGQRVRQSMVSRIRWLAPEKEADGR
jgi:hypothetical protein